MSAPRLFTRFTAPLAASLCLVAATPAFAGSFQSNGHHVEVRYGDLNLTTPAGKKELRSRIHAAASKVCVVNDDLEGFMTCRLQAIRNAREPMAAVIARAESDARYADAASPRVVVGN